jgi:hypothetical protein
LQRRLRRSLMLRGGRLAHVGSCGSSSTIVSLVEEREARSNNAKAKEWMTVRLCKERVTHRNVESGGWVAKTVQG